MEPLQNRGTTAHMNPVGLQSASQKQQRPPVGSGRLAAYRDAGTFCSGLGMPFHSSSVVLSHARGSFPFGFRKEMRTEAVELKQYWLERRIEGGWQRRGLRRRQMHTVELLRMKGGLCREREAGGQGLVEDSYCTTLTQQPHTPPQPVLSSL
ncbi:hypothetical protein SKAU_G00403250 [Synaphobranchus kaupii]|uniref:Uncharacterized protein n=1 Tax=Synaphobranchus kaupii TaxID=118154 RepID=A0A9Q1E9I3_SYNKA|nr:hypothetical protein SKAU_G00403250 [Synaphobranchus kaupii]